MDASAKPYPALLLGLLIAAASLFFFAWLANEMLSGSTLQFDESIRASIHQVANPALTSIMRSISFLGEPAFLVPLGMVTVFHLTRTGRPRMAVLFAITVFGAEGLDQLLKFLFHRTRPAAFFGYPEPAGYSFPSGHALVSCAFFGVLATFAVSRAENKRIRWIYRITAAALIAAIGISRVYLGVHYPSDVLAGYAAALVWVYSVASLRRWWRSRSQQLL